VGHREELVAVVESYLEGFVRKEFARLPLASDYIAESPLGGRLSGKEALDYLKVAASRVKGIRIEGHIVEGDHVATLLEEETDRGPLRVFARFRIEAGRIREALVFYDPRRVVGQADPP